LLRNASETIGVLVIWKAHEWLWSALIAKVSSDTSGRRPRVLAKEEGTVF
jgi:hypothetical protein